MNYKMTEEEGEKYLDFLEKNSQDKEKSVHDLDELLLINLDQIRKFISSLLTLNITLIAGVFAVLVAYGENITGKTPVTLGVALLSFNTLLLSLYINYILVTEHNRLNRRRDYLNKSYDELIQMGRDSIVIGKSYAQFREDELTALKRFSEEEQREIKNIEGAFLLKIEITYIFSTLLVVALMLISWSLFDWGSVILNYLPLKRFF